MLLRCVHLGTPFLKVCLSDLVNFNVILHSNKLILTHIGICKVKQSFLSFWFAVVALDNAMGVWSCCSIASVPHPTGTIGTDH